MQLLAVLVFCIVLVKGQDFGALLAPLLAGGANGGGLQKIFEGLGGGSGQHDFGSLFKGLLGNHGTPPAPVVAPAPGPDPAPVAIGGPTNTAVPDESDYKE
ncbi:unnamed protein product [Heligmosomoides polygyrus]|uniref:Secreted protein n=1 Tax=Heligmosomoides polygyrus TaxID=6339 RepID=A0A183FSI9_HELPZ|nr:unnamed protein product [Heligmosomoides polygyrus]